MKKNKMISGSSYKKNNILFSALEHNFNLPVLINLMINENELQKDVPIVKILFNSYEKQIVLTLLHESTEIDSFQGNESVKFQIIYGKLKFRTREESVLLKKGQILELNKKLEYRLICSNETVFILTIIKSILKLCKN